MALRKKVEREFSAGMPWRNALDEDERACLLGLIRKMISAENGAAGSTTPAADGQYDESGHPADDRGRRGGGGERDTDHRSARWLTRPGGPAARQTASRRTSQTAARMRKAQAEQQTDDVRD